MADILEILDRLEAPRRRELESQSGLLQAGNILLGQRIQPNRFESRTETFLAPLIQALAGSSLRELGQKGIQEEIGGFRSAVSEAFSQPDRRQALTQLSEQPGFDSVSNIVAALDIQNQEREREIEALRRKSQLQQELAPKIDEGFASVLAPRLGVPADFLVGRPESILSKIKAPSGPSTIVNVGGAEQKPFEVEGVTNEALQRIETAIPKGQKNQAFKELGTLDTIKAQKRIGDEMYTEALGIPTVKMIDPLSAENARTKVINQNITSVGAKAVKGAMSDQDFANQIQGFLIEARDSKDRIKEKAAGFQRFIDLNRTPTPLLDRVGASKLVLEEEIQRDVQLGGQAPDNEKERLRARVRELKAQGLTAEEIKERLAGG